MESAIRESTNDAELGVCIFDHYPAPRMAVYVKGNVEDAVQFELGNDDEIIIANKEGFSGDLERAETVLRQAIGLPYQLLQANKRCWSPDSSNCDCPACGGFND